MDSAHDETATGPNDTAEGTVGEGFEATAGPDGEPTPDQESAADRGAAAVDIESVKAHEDEMNELGANVKGEGEVE